MNNGGIAYYYEEEPPAILKCDYNCDMQYEGNYLNIFGSTNESIMGRSMISLIQIDPDLDSLWRFTIYAVNDYFTQTDYAGSTKGNNHFFLGIYVSGSKTGIIRVKKDTLELEYAILWQS